MRITTWNVNGIRNPFGYAPWNTVRTFPGMFDILQSDIIVMQELKIQRKDLRDDMVLLDGWDCYFSLPKHKKGYSGVGIYTRNDTCCPIKAEEGLLGVLSPPGKNIMYRDLSKDECIGGYPTDEQIIELGVDPTILDSEGRCLCLEFQAFVLIGVYSPANSNGSRDDFRYGFLCALDCRIRNLIKMNKRVILVGDLNVSRDEIDTACSSEDMKKKGITHDEYISTPNRRVFNQMIIGGQVFGERDVGREESIMWDLTREFHPSRRGMYTHWEQKINARPGNYGSRIDFVLVSKVMKDWFDDSNIQEGLLGSDHCPVYGHFKNIITIDGKEVYLIDIMNPVGYFINGQREKEWSVKDIPLSSGRLLPEFDKRRSIKAMFTKPTMLRSNSSIQSTNDDVVSDNNSIINQDNKSIINQDITTGNEKRKATDQIINNGKKQKSINSIKSPKIDSTKGQQSLKGFFAPKTIPLTKTSALNSNNMRSTTPEMVNQQYNNINNPSTPLQSFIPTSTNQSQSPYSPASISTTETVHDPIATKDSWSKLMRRPVQPMCEGHNEPCKVMLTKKKGENQGRSFWMCTRPLGPSGVKEKNSQWRCGTFIWCSDLKGSNNTVVSGVDIEAS